MARQRLRPRKRKTTSGRSHQAAMICAWASRPMRISAATTAAAIIQSSPMMKSYQNFAKLMMNDTRSSLCGDGLARSSGGAQAAQGADVGERDDQIHPDERQNGDVRARPVDAQTLDRPEGAKGGEQNANAVLEGVFGHAAEGPMHDKADAQHQHQRDGRAQRRQGHLIGGGPKGDDDKDNLQPFEQHALKAEGEGVPV